MENKNASGKLSPASNYDKVIDNIVSVIFIATTCIYLFTSFFGSFSDMVQRSLLVTLCGVALFLKKGLKIKGKTNRFTRIVDIVFAAMFAAGGIYIMVIWRDRVLKTGASPTIDIVMGTIFVVLLLVITRRSIGNFIVAICIFLMIYTVFGSFFPDFMAHRGETWSRFISFLYVTTEGVFGTTAGTASSYIILFVTFGAFMETLGAGEWFVDIAYALTGRFRGGPAKAAIGSSALMGMISGSPAANVATTGTFTIPLMKRIGYKPEEAGAVEAVASTGGLFTPPVMGAAAFIMAENIGVPYGKVALAAVFPALLYYFSLILSVDAIAVKRGLVGLQRSELPSAKKAMMERGWFALPIVGLIIGIICGWSAMKAASYAIIGVVIISFAQRSTRKHPKILLTALKKSTQAASSIVVTCACAGIIVGAIAVTGLGAKLSYTLISIANGNPYIAAIIVAVVAIILGCGMPPTTVYIIVSAILARPLISMGVQALPAHMFIFMFSCVGAITPPVALAAYTAAGIAGSNANKTGFMAFRYGAMAFIIPFMFLLSPQLLLVGSFVDIALSIVTATVGVVCLATAFEGYFFWDWCIVSRLMLGAAALLMIKPGLSTDLIGACLIAIAAVINFVLNKKKRNAAA